VEEGMGGEVKGAVFFATLMDCSIESTGCTLYFKNGSAKDRGKPMQVVGGVLIVCLHTPERCSTLVEYVLEIIMFAAVIVESMGRLQDPYIPRNVLL
jgi:hypothetical protein